MTVTLAREAYTPTGYPNDEAGPGDVPPTGAPEHPEPPNPAERPEPSVQAEAVFTTPPPLAEKWGEDAYKTAFRAIAEQFPRSGPRHARAENKPLPPSYRANIVGTGIVGTHTNSKVFVSAATNPRAGTLTMAAGTTHAAAIAAAHAFVRATEHENTRDASLQTASQIITNAVERTVPAVADLTAKPKPRTTEKATEGGSDKTDALADHSRLPGISLVTAQLAGEDQLIFTGPRPTYVLNEQTGEYRDFHDEQGGGSTQLQAGRNVLIISSARRPNDERLSAQALTTELLGVLTELSQEQEAAYQAGVSMLQSSDQATQIAGRLRSRLLARGIDTGVMQVALIDVEPSLPAREVLAKSHLAPFALPTPASVRRVGELAGTALYGEVGQAAPRLLKLRATLGTAALLLAGTAAAYTGLRYGLGHAGIDLPNLLSLLPHRGGSHETQHNPETTANTHPDSNNVQHMPDPNVTVSSAEPAPFPDSYTALSSDPELGGNATSVDLLSSHIITYYGNQYHLPPDEIARLAHDPHTIAEVSRAFAHDQTNPHNIAVLHSKNWYLNEGDTYSTTDQAQTAQEAVIARAHALGIDTNPPIAAEVAQPPISLIPTQPTTPETTTHVPTQAENIAAFGRNQRIGLAAITGVTALALGVSAWWSGRGARQTRRQERRLESYPPDVRSHRRLRTTEPTQQQEAVWIPAATPPVVTHVAARVEAAHIETTPEPQPVAAPNTVATPAQEPTGRQSRWQRLTSAAKTKLQHARISLRERSKPVPLDAAEAPQPAAPPASDPALTPVPDPAPAARTQSADDSTGTPAQRRPSPEDIPPRNIGSHQATSPLQPADKPRQNQPKRRWWQRQEKPIDDDALVRWLESEDVSNPNDNRSGTQLAPEGVHDEPIPQPVALVS